MNTVTDRQLRTAKKTMAVGGVPGLTLRVTATGHKSFVLRMIVAGKPKWVPVCKFEAGLAEARKRAKNLRFEFENDPFGSVTLAQEIEDNKRRAKQYVYTVENLLLDYIDSENSRGRWSNKGRQPHEVKFKALVKNHFSERLRTMPAMRLTPEILAKEFQDKWETMRSTPDKCLGELRRAWYWGIAMKKIPSMQNPAETNVLKHLLAAPSRRPKKTHFPYVEPERIPELIKEIRARSGCAAYCLLFDILTCSRISNVLNCKWKQIDFKKRTFTIPRDEMKVKGLTFDRVTPLSKQAIELLEQMPRFPDTDYIFIQWQTRTNEPLSETSLRNLIRRINSERHERGLPEFKDPVEIDNKGVPRNPVPHGLARTSFDTWAGSPSSFEHELFDNDMVDACLDHFNPKYGGAYMRAYPLEDMRKILQAWADYCFSK